MSSWVTLPVLKHLLGLIKILTANAEAKEGIGRAGKHREYIEGKI